MNLQIEYLGFRACGEALAFDVAAVQEVFDISDIASLPSSPDFIVGMAGIRGNIVPVLDLLNVHVEQSLLSRAIVLKTPMGQAAFLISGIDDIIKFSSIEPPDRIPPGLSNIKNSISGFGLYENSGYFIVDTAVMIQETLPKKNLLKNLSETITQLQVKQKEGADEKA